MNPTQQQIHQFITENNFSEVFKLLELQNSHLQEINRLKNTFIQGKHDVDFVQQLRTLTDTIFENLSNSKSQNQMEETILAALVASSNSQAIAFLNGIGVNFAYDKLKNSESLKKINQKVRSFFKGKPTEDTLEVLGNAIKDKNKEKFEAKFEQVKEILKTTLEKHPDFKKEIENILNGLDGETKNELSKATQHITIQNSKNVMVGNTFEKIGGSIQIGDNNGNQNEK